IYIIDKNIIQFLLSHWYRQLVLQFIFLCIFECYYCGVVIFYFKSGNSVCFTFAIFICTFNFLYIVITWSIIILIGNYFQCELPVFHRQFLAIMPLNTFFECKCIYFIIFGFPTCQIWFILPISIHGYYILMNKIIYFTINSTSGKAIYKESFRRLVNCICY